MSISYSIFHTFGDKASPDSRYPGRLQLGQIDQLGVFQFLIHPRTQCTEKPQSRDLISALDDRARFLCRGAHSRPYFGFDPLIAGNCFQVLERAPVTQSNISEIIASRGVQFH
jgi:hypothetical protein